MARKHVASNSVSKQDFELAYKWIAQNKVGVHGQIKSPKPISNVIAFLDCLRNQPWKRREDGGLSFDVDVFGLAEGSLVPLATNVRRYLQEASLALGMHSALSVRRERREGGKRYRLCWEPLPAKAIAATPEPAIGGPTFSAIALFGKIWGVEYSAEFLRGVYSMAGELGIQISDLRTPETLSEMGHDHLIRLTEGLNPTNTSILIIFDNTEHTGEQAEHLRSQSFHVVATGYLQRALSINNAQMAEMLADQCIADHRATKEKQIVYMFQLARRSTSRDYAIRTPGLKRKLDKSGLFDVQEITVDQNEVPHHDNSPQMIAAVEAALRQIDPTHAVALFPRIDPFTKMAIRWIAANPSYRHVKIYGEKLLSRDLAILTDPESPLAAVCGVDPYYYGRYAVRAASMRSDGVKLPDLPPLLITKREASELHIRSTDRIPAYFKGCDVRLLGRPFAWFDWMRHRCPGSFGPDHLTPVE